MRTSSTMTMGMPHQIRVSRKPKLSSLSTLLLACFMGFLTVRFHALAPIIAAQYRKSAPRRVAEEPISRFICDSNSLLGVVAALDDTSGLTAQVAQVVQLSIHADDR